MSEKYRVWLSIGSNLQRRKNILGSIDALRSRFGELVLSAVYRSASVGFDGADFYNLVAGIRTDLPVPALIEVLRDIEKQHDRVRGGVRFGPRTLDIDVLTYADQVLKTGTVEIPRDEILEYAFVLGPLAEVAANELHPVNGKRYADLWARFSESKKQSLHRVSLD